MEINSSKKKKKKFEDEYKILEELLISKKVKIYKVQSKKDRLTCRMMHSIQKTSFCNLNDDKIMSKEFELLSKLSHPNIIKLFTFYTTDINFNIISEYFKEGTLDSKIKKHKIFTEKQVKHVVKQLLSVVKYLNENNLVHTDITPDIIYIKDIITEGKQELYNIKILQFGSSTINIHNTNNALYYMSPELIGNKYHQTSDIWSIGVILYQMIYDNLPFKGYKEDEIINNIKKLNVVLPDKTHHSHISKSVKNLIKRMLNKNPFKRIKVDECLNHEWFTGIHIDINQEDSDSNSNSSNSSDSEKTKENKKDIKLEEINTDAKKSNKKLKKKKSSKIMKSESKDSCSSDSEQSSKNSASLSSEEKSISPKKERKKKSILKNHINRNDLTKNKNEIISQVNKRSSNIVNSKSKILFNNQKTHELIKCYSSNMIETLSIKSNGKRISPLLIDTIKYIKYNIQIIYKRNDEEEKIKNIFDQIVIKKNNKIDDNTKITYEELYIGYLNYIGQKRLILDSYSDNKILFVNLCNLINENKKNGNEINPFYDKNDFVRILITLKEKYYEHNLEKSYETLKKSSTKEIINCLNEIDKKDELDYFKNYIDKIKSNILENKFKEIYLFFEFKNLIIKTIKQVYNEKKKHKKKVSINLEMNKIHKSNSKDNKNIGIKGIIRLVDKKGK